VIKFSKPGTFTRHDKTGTKADGEYRQQMDDPGKPALIYDNSCTLCNNAVRFLKAGRKFPDLYYFPSTEEQSKLLMDLHRIPRELAGNTLILIDVRKVYVKSAAIIKALQKKGGYWKLAGFLYIIPRFIRDAIYDQVAKNRLKMTR